MSGAASRQIVIAGAGIAGLTAALAFASHGFLVRVLEQAPALEAAGAGLQLSPNATRLLARFGVLELARPASVRPEAVVLRDGASLREVARIPLGAAAEDRWGAPYLAMHRADLQSALLARVASEPDIRLDLAAPLRDAALHAHGVTVSVDLESRPAEIACRLLVGADGVHSAARNLGGGGRLSSFGGELAWRTTILAHSPAGKALAGALSTRVVTAFLRPGFHLIAYPVRAGDVVNLVAFTRSAANDGANGLSASGFSDTTLRRDLSRCAAPLQPLLQAGMAWSAWPVHTVDPRPPWTSPKGVALIGDAAHAMTPYAAQGAAMAIEDAVTLADAVAARRDDIGGALSAWEASRRPRIARVARRAALNRLAWHAAGPVATVRNLVLAARGSEKLAADLDWLYGWRPPATG